MSTHFIFSSFETPTLQISGISRIVFWYHLYDAGGKSHGALNVFRTKDTREPILSRTTNQRNEWVKAFIDINLDINERVRSLKQLSKLGKVKEHP